MDLQIQSFILKDKNIKKREAKYFVNIENYNLLDKRKLDYDYLEGAIIIKYNNNELLGFREWDLIDQLWHYFLDSIDKLETQTSVQFSFPDQPYLVSIEKKGGNFIISLNGNQFSIKGILFVSKILESANIFFNNLLILFPEYQNDVKESIALIKNIEKRQKHEY